MKSSVLAALLILTAILPVSCTKNSGTNETSEHEGPADPEILKIFETVCPADEALELSRKTDTVVFEAQGCTSGKDIWDSFYQDVMNGSPASVLLAHYYTLDPQHMSEELYEEEKDLYPKLFFYLLEYEGKEYSLRTRESSEETPDDQQTFQYLLHFAGDTPSTALYASYDNYVLADDPEVTWDRILAGMASSQSGAAIRHCTVFRDYAGWRGD